MTGLKSVEARFNEVVQSYLDLVDKGLTLDSDLMGGSNPIDSVELVELCIRLEDLADELGFKFDWTSENAMSRSRSVFRSVTTLRDEFARQSMLAP
jgi:acyl carrier protein